MTRNVNIKSGLTGFAAALALAAGLFVAPDAMAGDRGERWRGGDHNRVARHVERNRVEHRRFDRRPVRRAAPRRQVHVYHHVPRRPVHVYRHVPRRVHRPVYVERRDFPVGAVIAGIGVGIVTHAILSSHYHD
jgi:hypothetical protein